MPNQHSGSSGVCADIGRRRVLHGIAGTGAAASAGCLGDNGGSGTTRFTVEMGNQPNQINYNPYGQQTPGVLNKIIFEQGMKWYAEDEEWLPLAVENMEYPSTIQEGETIRLDLFEGYTWFNGDAYTAADFHGQLRWMDANGDPVWNFLDAAEQTGEYSVELTLSEQVDERLFENALFGMGDNPMNLVFKLDFFEEYLEDMEAADSDEERGEVLKEVAQLNVSLEEALEEGLGNGPFKPKEATANQLILVKHEDYESPHISADDIPFEEIEALPLEGPQDKLNALRNDEVDALHNVGFDESQADQVPDHFEAVNYYSHSGEAVAFNCRRDPLNNQRVRWAISHVLKARHDTLMQNLPLAEVNRERVGLSAGMSEEMIDHWIGDRRDEYMQFDGGTERATELLEEEGFSQEDDEWYTPDREQFTLTFRDAGFHADRTQTASQILTDFGIETEPIIVEDTTYFGETVPNRDYDLTNWWVGQSAPLPYEGLHNNLVGEAYITAYPLGVPSQTDWEGEGTSEFVVEVPPIGEPEGDLRELDIVAELEAIASTNDEEEQRVHIQEVTWFWNWSNTYWGPWTLYLASEYYNTRDWEWPDAEDPVMQAPTVQDWPIRKGYPKPQ